MTTYIELGSRKVVGAPDQTGNNPGNWTVVFDATVLNTNMPYFEVYKVVLQGATGSAMDWFIETHQWETTIAADDNAWDPAQPALVRAGESMYFYYDDPVTDNFPPTVTIWLRYDQDIAANQRAANA